VILKALPKICELLVRNNMAVDATVTIPIRVGNELVKISSLNSKQVKSELIIWKTGILKLDLARIYKLPLFCLSKADYLKIWAIKNPTLRATRLKVLYKDVFCNERRHRFGIAESPNCIICGQIESIQHHLVSCENAKRIWNFCDRIDRFNIGDITEVLRVEHSSAMEIVKSVALKFLIQINRSKDLTFEAFSYECLRYLNLEQIANSNDSEVTIAIDRVKELLRVNS
jgi:hypothetical protein